MSMRLQRRKILAVFIIFAGVYVALLFFLHTDEPAIHNINQQRRISKTRQKHAKHLITIRRVTHHMVKRVKQTNTMKSSVKQTSQEQAVEETALDIISFKEDDLQVNNYKSFMSPKIRLEPLLAGLPDSQQKEDADDVELWRQLQENRLRTLRQACTKTNDSSLRKWLQANHAYLENILVSDKYRTLYCYVPKIACTNWKKAFLLLNGMVGDKNEARIQAHKQKQTLNMYSEEDALYRIQNYTGFIFARNPLSRVLSTFREKFSPERRGRYHWTKHLGNAIYFRYGNHTWHNPLPENGYNVSFQEFIRYVGDRRATFNHPGAEHWKPIVDICYPCQIKYSVIGKFETFEFDAKHILRNLGREDLKDVVLQKSDHSTGSSSKALLLKYYSNITKSDMKGLAWRYRADTEIFGYRPWKF